MLIYQKMTIKNQQKNKKNNKNHKFMLKWNMKTKKDKPALYENKISKNLRNQ